MTAAEPARKRGRPSSDTPETAGIIFARVAAAESLKARTLRVSAGTKNTAGLRCCGWAQSDFDSRKKGHAKGEGDLGRIQDVTSQSPMARLQWQYLPLPMLLSYTLKTCGGTYAKVSGQPSERGI
jgi:hypothetical protein